MKQKSIILFLCLMVALGSRAQTSTKEVTLKTTAGDICIALYDETPLHRDNFLKLARMHVYDSLLFHRVIKDFVIQAGDLNSKYAKPGQRLGTGELDYTIEPEFRLPNIRHRRGAVGMAREDDKVNPEMRSGACQFYIVTRQEGTPHLDGKYTVFGEVKEGMEVADSIQSSATDKYDRPLEDIRILSVVVPEEPKVEPKQSTKPSRPAKKRPRIK
jgi:peptidyl-prolyl cis-trans isomerase B (cyclophilin B)